MRKRSAPALPSKAEVLDFIRSSPRKVGKREIAQAFGIKGPAKIALKSLLKEIVRDGEVDRSASRRFAARGDLPDVVMVEITGIDRDEGEALARPLDWEDAEPPPALRIRAERGAVALNPGDRALVRIEGREPGATIARLLRRIEAAPEKVLGVYQRGADGGRLVPTEKKIRTEFVIAAGNAGSSQPGELVLAEVLPGRRLGLPSARIVERLGDMANPKAASLIAIHTHDIPVEFSEAALAQARGARPAPLGEREDLRPLPLVTIDGEDARDFDDGVFAEPDDDPKNPAGFHLVVAIADVAWYVRPGDALDRAAQLRGNSVYFPDRVVPMLPERLSNDLCSLRPREDRPVLAVHMWIDAHGNKRRHRFVRGMMHSAARLTYDEAQAAADGSRNKVPSELKTKVIDPLFAAYHALSRARRARGTLDLDLEELKVILDDSGKVRKIEPRPRYDSHRLIEEFMIAANVCAAETLEEHRLPCMYRVHDQPAPEKIDALRDVLGPLGFKLARGQVMRPEQFMRVLDWAADKPFRHMVDELVLRSQSLAIYSPDNIGHFGLALKRYAHFTSPIRRYADLLVHRALIAGLGLGEGGLFEGGGVDFHGIAEHISATERRAAAAERDARNRYIAAYLADRIGGRFPGRVSGVAKFGIFVALDNIGADGLVPVGSLTDDFYRHDPDRHRLEGQRSGRVFTLGDRVDVRLAEANPVTGGLIFELIEGGRIASTERRGSRRQEARQQERKQSRGRGKPGPRRRR
ncbi:MAG TPA: ribonuclease R [Alphaproteobacteria bacterium]|nr:ribonuclease R [Alphaproteobacteria bacterium]